mmetsp:Transcript_51086/g.150634  ORF Transcript_51086/g.150634 Transcript_51086/m.150634 type:complete len:583 (-) Transcript_51086:34-1782(-)
MRSDAQELLTKLQKCSPSPRSPAHSQSAGCLHKLDGGRRESQTGQPLSLTALKRCHQAQSASQLHVADQDRTPTSPGPGPMARRLLERRGSTSDVDKLAKLAATPPHRKRCNSRPNTSRCEGTGGWFEDLSPLSPLSPQSPGLRPGSGSRLSLLSARGSADSLRNTGESAKSPLALPVLRRRRPSDASATEAGTQASYSEVCDSPPEANSPTLSTGSGNAAPERADQPRELRELRRQNGKTPKGGLHARRQSDLRLAPLQVPERSVVKEIRCLGENEKIYDMYKWDEVLQETGDGGKVVVCKRKDSPRGKYNYVLKIRSKESLREQEHETEFRKSQVRMLNMPPHVGVMPIREVLEDDNFYYMVMDKAKGGGFFTSLLKEFGDGVMPQKAVKSLIREILEAIHHVHEQGMLHRDIKPDNLVMQLHDDPRSPTGKVAKVMLIDFDHADPDFSPVSPKRASDSCYGTLRFNAPESLNGEYSASSDLFSVGAILYLIMAGKLPYDDELYRQEDLMEAQSPKIRGHVMNQVFESLKKAEVDFDCSPWPEQTDCRDFCKELLKFDPDKRFQSAKEALAHQWLSKKEH